MARTYIQGNYILPTVGGGSSSSISYSPGTAVPVQDFVPPTITSLIPGNETITILFSDGNDYTDRELSYAIYVNGSLWGYTNVPNTGGGGSILASGFTNGRTYYIKIAAMTLYAGNAISYKGSKFSNTMTAKPVYSLPSTQGNISFTSPILSSIDVVRQPRAIVATSSLLATSTYTNQGDPNQYNPYQFSSRFCLATYNGSVKLKARVIFGGKDGTYFGDVDHVFKDVDVKLNHVFNVLANENKKTLKNLYDEGSISLSPVPLSLSDNMEYGLTTLLKKEYYLNKKILEKNVKSSIKSNFVQTLKSRYAARRFIDIISFQENDLNGQWQEFELPYKGTIWLNVKLLIASLETSRFNYSLVDSNGKTLKTGRNAGVLLLSDIQDSSSFSFGVLEAVTSDQDLYGSVEVIP